VGDLKHVGYVRDQVAALVADELSVMPAGPVREAVAACLVPPAACTRGWSYSDAEFQTWCIAVRGDTELHFCPEGFGPSDPWGVLRAHDPDLGTDDCWYATLSDAVIAAGWVLSPDGHIVQ
jgi:hypothetical protein